MKEGKTLRTAIPRELRRRVLMEARHRCVICREFTVEIHHIVPFREKRSHEYKNLIALCPTCHTKAHDGTIDLATVRRHKAVSAASMLHQIVDVLIDFNQNFDAEFGPSTRNEGVRNNLIVNLRSRDMLAGLLSTISWPLVRCELCESLVSVDRSWTVQDNCMCEPEDRLAVFCDFGCAKKYQDHMRPLLEADVSLIGEYMLQNTVQIVEGSVGHI